MAEAGREGKAALQLLVKSCLAL